MLDIFGMDHQALYTLRDEFAVPYLRTPGPLGGTMKPHRMTPDALMGLLVLKCQENLPDRILGALFGESSTTVNDWLHGLRDYIYQHDQWLIRSRNLSDPR